MTDAWLESRLGRSVLENLESKKGNIRANRRKWGHRYSWPKDGDEWGGQAALCGIAYDEWKASLVRHLILPFVTQSSHVLEIAPGHGRWTEILVAQAARVTIVDLSNSNLEFCKQRFPQARMDCFETDGSSLPADLTGEIDFVWSYDAFVHMAAEVVRSYVEEIARVLKSGGTAVLHHADIENPLQHRQKRHPGWRSGVNVSLVRSFAEAAGLVVVSQFTYWDEQNRVGVPRYGDKITRLAKP